jgi:hypothetical protein
MTLAAARNIRLRRLSLLKGTMVKPRFAQHTTGGCATFPVRAASELSEAKFHEQADSTLEAIQDSLTEIEERLADTEITCAVCSS